MIFPCTGARRKPSGLEGMSFAGRQYERTLAGGTDNQPDGNLRIGCSLGAADGLDLGTSSKGPLQVTE